MISRLPESKKYNKEFTERFEAAKELVSAIRTVRIQKEIPNRDKISLLIFDNETNADGELLPVIRKLCNIEETGFVTEKVDGAAAFMVGTKQYFIPLTGKIDVEGERQKLNQELQYYTGFLQNVMKKLDNERFVANAPSAVLEMEKKKKSDAESKIKTIEEALEALK